MFKTILASAFVAGILLLLASLMDVSLAQQAFFADIIELVSWSLMGWFLTGALWVRLPKALAGTWVLSIFMTLVWYFIYGLFLYAPFLLALIVPSDLNFFSNLSSYFNALKLLKTDPAQMVETYNLTDYILGIFQLKIMIYMLFIGAFVSSILRLIAETLEDGGRLEAMSWRGISAAPHFLARVKIISILIFGLLIVQAAYNFFFPITGGENLLNSILAIDTGWSVAWVAAILRAFSNETLAICLIVAAILIFLPTAFIDNNAPNRFWRKSALLLMSAIWLLASFVGYQSSAVDWGFWAKIVTIAWFLWFIAIWPLACIWDKKLARI